MPVAHPIAPGTPGRTPGPLQHPTFARRARASRAGLAIRSAWAGLAMALLALLVLGMARPAQAVDIDTLLPVEDAFALSAEAVPGGIRLRWEVAEGYYLYRHTISVRGSEGFTPETLALPSGVPTSDEFFGDTEIYRGQVEALLPGQFAAGASVARLSLRYQGCADVGVCYPPHVQQIEVPLAPTAVGGGGDLLRALGAPRGGGLGLGLDTGFSEDLPLPEEQAFRVEAIADGPEALLIRFRPAQGYYLYRDKTSYGVSTGDGPAVLAGRMAWPAAEIHEDEFFGEMAVYFDEVEARLPLQRAATAAQALTLHLSFQGCQTDGICYPPMQRRFELELPAGGRVSTAAQAIGEAVANGRAPTEGPASPGGIGALALALLLALGGGLILNLMPCVLPILSLKALSLADGGRGHDHARRGALWYTAGVLSSFALVGLVVIGLRATGAALGWGFQLQQPLVVGALAYLMFAIGLSLSGVFTLGGSLAGIGQALTERKGPSGDFFTGVLAVVVASPCTAPLMTGALAFAFAAPPLMAVLVFLALGLGLALPFLLIGFIPALANRLPRPGAWMEGFKQLMAFPMYLTAVWLVWLLARQRGADAVALVLAGAVLLAMALWWMERLRFRDRPLARAAAVLLGVAALLPLWQVQQLPAGAANGNLSAHAEAWSAERLRALRAEGVPVFVNMTADWCVTCKANERRVLAAPEFVRALEDTGTRYLVGDWTNVDPAITAYLESHRAVGVPLYVHYPANGGTPRVLPTLLGLADTVATVRGDAR